MHVPFCLRHSYGRVSPPLVDRIAPCWMLPLSSNAATAQPLRYADLATHYVWVLCGLFAHIYITFAVSLYFEMGLHLELGISRESLVTYFSLLSIVLLLLTMNTHLSWPLRVEEALLVIFAWILLGNLIARDCMCCAPPVELPLLAPTASLAQAPSLGEVYAPLDPVVVILTPPAGLSFGSVDLLYTLLCLVLLGLGFALDARSQPLVLAALCLVVALIVAALLLPLSCNQFTFIDYNILLLKFTLFNIVWYYQRYLRLTERVLLDTYLRLMPTVAPQAARPVDESPAAFFATLAQLQHKKKSGDAAQKLGAEVQRLAQQRGLLSWKNRGYGANALLIGDLARTVWILTICPAGLLAVAFELALQVYQVNTNFSELAALQKPLRLAGLT
jgi:hypothetical protein